MISVKHQSVRSIAQGFGIQNVSVSLNRIGVHNSN